jgi:heptosyltransferase-3
VDQPNNILIVRTDRIGDVVLSLPMIAVLRRRFPSARVSMLLREYTRELAEGQGLDRILLYDRGGVPKPFFRMLRELRAQRFDLVIVSYPTFRLTSLIFASGIPLRVGTGYRWYSMLFNKRVYEHRKTAEKHELEYNLSLLSALGVEAEENVVPVLSLAENHHAAAQQVLDEWQIGAAEQIVVLHPGSGGSARDWSPEKFGQLARRLHADGYTVVVTGGPGEKTLVQRVALAAGGNLRQLVGRLSLRELAAFLRRAELVVANSTGPLHLAAAVGTPVVGLYPPILACSPKRWGPYTDKRAILVPDPEQCPRCKGGACQGNDCMETITVAQVLEAARPFLTLPATKRQTQVPM